MSYLHTPLRYWLVTGGTGTFGHALVERLLTLPYVERVAIYSRDEKKQSEMQAEYLHDPTDPKDRLRFFLGDVRDPRRLALAMRGAEVVIHAAALKQVPALEYNPSEAVRTNVEGALNVVDAALNAPSVRRVVGLSTDKASQPLNLYGATKLTMERLLVAANAYAGAGGPAFCCTRYGNVAGSRGSVLPLWKHALDHGAPIPVTDPEMTRFWMTTEQAVDLVLRAVEWPGAHGARGVVRIPALPAYSVGDLATAFAAAYGEEPSVNVVGVRPGEKRHETLIGHDESVMAAFDEHVDGDVVLLPGPAPADVAIYEQGDHYGSDNGRRMDVPELTERLRSEGWGRPKITGQT